jgi:hypothetical protein
VYNISGDSQQSNERFLLFSDRNDSPVMALNFDKDLIKVDGALPEDLGLYNEGMQIRATSLSACKFSINCYDSTNGVGISNVGGIVFRRLPTGTVNDQNSINLLDGGGVSYFDYIYSISGSVARRGMISTFRDGSGIKHLFDTTEPGNNCFVLTSSGNVGIGTNTPANYQLHIVRKAGTSGNLLLDGNTSVSGNPKIIFRDTNTSNVGVLDFNDTANSFTFSRNLLITGSGAIGGGTTDFYGLYVKNSAGVNLFGVRNDGLVSFPKINDFTIGATPNAYIVNSGSFGIYISTSSIRYKRDVVNYDKGIDTVKQLRPVYYKGKTAIDGDKQYAGFIAEEIHELGLTEFVQYNEDGSPNSLAYPNMMALAIKAIQELKAEIELLKVHCHLV